MQCALVYLLKSNGKQQLAFLLHSWGMEGAGLNVHLRLNKKKLSLEMITVTNKFFILFLYFKNQINSYQDVLLKTCFYVDICSWPPVTFWTFLSTTGSLVRSSLLEFDQFRTVWNQLRKSRCFAMSTIILGASRQNGTYERYIIMDIILWQMLHFDYHSVYLKLELFKKQTILIFF